MSAVYILRFRGQPVRFTFQAGKSIYQIVPRAMATPFPSEADAWHAASQHGINTEFLSVENLNRPERAKEEGALL